MNAKKPFGQIHKLPDMSMKFVQQYGALLEKEAEALRPILEDDQRKVLNILEEKEFAPVFRDKFVHAFEELRRKLDTSNEIAGVKNIRLESDTRKLRCLDEMTEYEEIHRPKVEATPLAPSDASATTGSSIPSEKTTKTPVLPKQKKRKNLSISNVAGARTYAIEMSRISTSSWQR